MIHWISLMYIVLVRLCIVNSTLFCVFLLVCTQVYFYHRSICMVSTCKHVRMSRAVFNKKRLHTHVKWSFTLQCVSKSSPFYFCDYSVKYWPTLIIFGNIAAEKICNLIIYSFRIISTVCVWILQNRKTKILYAFNAATSSCHCASILQLLPADPNLYSEINYLLHNL